MSAVSSLIRVLNCMLASMESTIRSNAKLGPPIDFQLYPNDEFRRWFPEKIPERDACMMNLSHQRADRIAGAFESPRDPPELAAVDKGASFSLFGGSAWQELRSPRRLGRELESRSCGFASDTRSLGDPALLG